MLRQLTANRRVVSAMKDLVAKGKEDAFMVLNLNDIYQKHAAWRKFMPRVEPFYAVKCNDDPLILGEMVNLGMSFDCASKGEIEKVLSLGADPSSVIYANPCKQMSHLRYANQVGVNLLTFDNADELYKIKETHPNTKLLLRLLPDDSKSLCRLGNKYGASLPVVSSLLETSRRLDLDVCGVSYHVGSGCYDKSAFIDAIHLARNAFDIAYDMGIPMNVLDIGGGFPGEAVHDWGRKRRTTEKSLSFPDIANQISNKLDQLFPEGSGVRIIAEPGRYFVHSCATLATLIIARRQLENRQSMGIGSDLMYGFHDDTEFGIPTRAISARGFTSSTSNPSDNLEETIMYYINEGVYGTFNNVIYDHATVEPIVLTNDGNEVGNYALFRSSIWGPSCDGMDCVVKETYLPKLDIGSWLFFENMGAYTSCAAASFNGFELPSKLCLPFDEEATDISEVERMGLD